MYLVGLHIYIYIYSNSDFLLLWMHWLYGLFSSYVLIFNTLLSVRDRIAPHFNLCFFQHKCYYVIIFHYIRSCCHKYQIISKNAERKFSGSLCLCRHVTDRSKLSELIPRSFRQVKLLNMMEGEVVRLLHRKINCVRLHGLSPQVFLGFWCNSVLWR